jgi:hypothetical protein
MVQYSILREPSLALGLPVYLCASIIFPLHLGWTGTSLSGLACYLAAAVTIFSLVDGYTQRGPYFSFVSVIPQLFLSLLALALPASLAFAMGSIFGPIDEAYDEAVCASRGAGESDSTEAEADDTFDVTADCMASTIS